MDINLSAPDISQAEIDAVVAVLRTPTLSLGPKLTEFEAVFAGYVGRKYAVAVNSGTSGLHLCMLALGIGPGDEVITTPFSFVATTNCVLMVGAKPVFVDIDPVSYNITAEKVAERISPQTRALLGVEVFGNPEHLDDVYQLAREQDLLCIEDSCEALGSSVDGRKCGTLGDVSTFAFYPNKQMTTGEGGMIVTDDEKVANLCASFRNQGRDARAGWHMHDRLGYNYRMSDINCAIGLEQIRRIDTLVENRRRVAGWYSELLDDERRITVPREPAGCYVSWFVYVIRLQDEFGVEQRDGLLGFLREKGIGCSNYFPPIHLQPHIMEALGTKPGDYPITERIAQRTVALPFSGVLSKEQVQTVCNAVKAGLDTVTR